MLSPKKQKHRKWQKGRIRKIATRTNKISFGKFGLKSLQAKWIDSRQIEAARKTISRHLKRVGKLWIRIFPYKPITAKANETPMGKGKGTVEKYVAVVMPGTVMFEIDGVEEKLAREAMGLAAHKLPVKCKFIIKQ